MIETGRVGAAITCFIAPILVPLCPLYTATLTLLASACRVFCANPIFVNLIEGTMISYEYYVFMLFLNMNDSCFRITGHSSGIVLIF